MSLDIRSLLATASRISPRAPALLAPDREPLSYGELFHQAEQTVHTLNTLGIGCGDRIAMVLPNGPEMAACCLSVASAATSAPLNPSYSAAEFEFYLSDLKPQAIVVESRADSPVAAIASSATKKK